MRFPPDHVSLHVNMRLLGLDYGSKRIGTAISDELGITAQALSIIDRTSLQRDLAAVAEIVRRYGVDKIVIGYPLRLDGSAGVQCEKVDRFIAALATVVDLPIVKWDEALSTWEAERILDEAGVQQQRRKKLVDKIAAGIVLQSYLNSLSKKENKMS